MANIETVNKSLLIIYFEATIKVDAKFLWAIPKR